MDPHLADMILTGAALYLGVGIVFALVFVTLLLKRFDHNAAEAAPAQFRVLIFPGVMALWPLLAALLIARTLRGGEA